MSNGAERMIQVLDPFEKAIPFFSAEQVPSIHKIIPIQVKNGKCMQPDEGDPPLTQKERFPNQ